MALFLARFKTFIDDVSQITAADMHRLQDELIAINEWKDDEESTFIGVDGDGVSAAPISNGILVTSSSGATIHPITGLPAGVQISSIDITTHRVTGASNATYTLKQKVGATGTITSHGNVSATAGTPEQVSITAINKTLLTDAAYYVECVAGSTSTQGTHQVTVKWKRI